MQIFMMKYIEMYFFILAVKKVAPQKMSAFLHIFCMLIENGENQCIYLTREFGQIQG